ncbi:MAG: hypothetical protein AAGU25_01955, partial [bacterium]
AVNAMLAMTSSATTNKKLFLDMLIPPQNLKYRYFWQVLYFSHNAIVWLTTSFQKVRARCFNNSIKATWFSRSF